MKRKYKDALLNNKGVTGTDLVISIIILAMFTGVITNLMLNIYKTSLDIQKSANATAYATIILEKVDEKAYEEITSDFVNKLKATGEIAIDEGYITEFYVEENIEQDLIKKVKVSIKYNVDDAEKVLTINKLKIKEIYKDEVI